MTVSFSSLSIHLADEAATIALGEDLALTLRPGDWMALTGDLGAGKSTLSRALIRAMADEPELEVPSPTFTIMQSYPLRIPIAHLDLYRLSDVSELDELGLDEFLIDGVLLIEWPELAKEELPKATLLDLTLTHETEGRTANFAGPAVLIERLKRVRAIRSFLEEQGYGSAQRRYLSGDASPRKYELIRQSGTELVLMDWPRPLAGAIVKDGKTYAEIAHTAPDARSFVAIGRYLKEQGFTVPEIIAYDIDQGMMLLSDLGETGILDEDGNPIAERYIESAKWLAALHELPVASALPVEASDIYTVPPFDPEAIKIEVSLLIEWYLPHVTGAPCPDDLKAEYFSIWDDLISKLNEAEKSLLLRDFHSPNILWQNDKTGLAQVGVIDFQDAMIGPSAYDLASLVQDARVDVPKDLQAKMLSAYYAERQLSDDDKALFELSFAIMSAQRNCKLAGIWVRLMKRDGKPNYMRHMPRTFRYLNKALSTEPLSALREWFIRAGINLNQDEA
jgi:tRNA threonylcarbamoyl adenosine modification protein YjeE